VGGEEWEVEFTLFDAEGEVRIILDRYAYFPKKVSWEIDNTSFSK